MRSSVDIVRRLLTAGLVLAALWPAAAAAQNLSTTDVTRAIAAAAREANARGKPAVIAVVDRVGNVLGLFRMTDAPARVKVTSGRGIAVGNGLENVQDLFASLGLTASPSAETAAIAKAVTGAYLSSGGNAFTTRTASQIVQEHFNPGEFKSPSGPLFGVQFTQLPCSDLSVRFDTNAAVTGLVSATAGPKRSPLGLSADPGGMPLYKNGKVVGGIGVEADGVYTLDLSVGDFDNDVDEILAIAGQSLFPHPIDIQANRIFVEGKSLRFTDVNTTSLLTVPAAAVALPANGALVALTGYTAGAIIAGQTFGSDASGFRLEPTLYASTGRRVFVLTDGTNTNRYPPIDSTTPSTAAGGLTTNEVTTIVANALKIAFASRAQIRRPLDSHVQVSISVVDVDGNILAVARTSDGPIFGTDTSLQKARTAAFFSSPTAGDYLTTYDFGAVTDTLGDLLGVPAGQNVTDVVLADYLTAVRRFIASDALANGIAFADRSGGNLSRPFYPDGFEGRPHGPFSKPIDVWSPFNTGLQLDSVIDNIAQHIAYVDTAGGFDDSDATCSYFDRFATTLTRLANGFQIFPGSVPIYRDGAVIGGLGVSGDGIDQDDMVSFLGLNDAGLALGTGVGNAPPGLRADNLTPQGVRLRYVNCPYKPFIASSVQNVCHGK